ncbi:MAG TPA: PKD domain-containing protein [Candidatus Polarisedimenticolaceae bacterium]|nr:PKD domain-containing protein [Candidatus Polarisedimenticolaceae bacterium]
MSSAWAYYTPDGTKPAGPGAYQNPGDGICVIGVKLDGTMLVDWSIRNARDCVAWTRSADGTIDLKNMTTQATCQNATNPVVAPNDGYRHGWSTSLCYDNANQRGISRVDLDNTETMCLSKGGTIVTTGKCVAYGWVYLNRKDDGTLPITGTGIATTDGVQAADGLGFCATPMRMTGGTYTSAATCPSYHNSQTTAPAEWPACQSTLTGCQTQASYDAGLGWSFTSPNCIYNYGIKGAVNAALTKADGSTVAAGTVVDLTGITNQGDCLANGAAWDNWLPVTGTTTKDNTAGGDYAGMPAGTVIRRLDALTNVEDGGGEFYSGTGAICQKCHSDQSRSYQERQKPGFPKTRHKLAGDAIGKPFQPYFTAAGSDWGLQGVQCAMCHSTSKPARDDLIQVVPAGVIGPPAAGAPKSASGHNQTEYGTHLIDICYTCHGTAANPITTNPASVIPVSAGDFALTSKGLAPIANQFLNSPHAKYVGDSSKVDVGNKIKYTSTFEGYVCRVGIGKLSATTYPNSTACTAAGYTWYTTTSNGAFCYHSQTSCQALPGGQWATTFAATTYPWAADTGGPGAVCGAVGSGSIITTVYRNGAAHKIPNVDSTINPACTNAGDGGAQSGAGGLWLKDGETSPGDPPDTAQGNCMTCHDVHWALADPDPEAEPLRRECTTCHMNSGTSASEAPQVSLLTINHQGGVGTPLEHVGTEPASACESCHMPESADGKSPMHLWRINTDPNYVTMGAGQANTTPDGAYAAAAWVDLDHACGQCHGGGTSQDAEHQPVPPALYRTRASLALVAQGMHAASGANFAVTFRTTVTGLQVNADASVDCGTDSVGNPVPCPAFIYDWTWGDGGSHGAGDPASHTYATGGTYPITLVVTVQSSGQQVGAPVTRSVNITGGNQPPNAAGSCSWDPDTWKMVVTDTSSDPNDADLSHLQVIVDWGDGGAKSAVPRQARPQSVTKVYTRTGTFPATAKALDIEGLSSTYSCAVPATPAYFQITGTVTAPGAVPVPDATVTLTKGGIAVASKLTAVDGTYAFPNLKPGTYAITVVKRGYYFGPAPQAAGIVLGPNKVANVTAVSVLPGTVAPGKYPAGSPAPGRKLAIR